MPPLGWNGVKSGGRSGKTVATVPWTLGTVIRKAVNVDKKEYARQHYLKNRERIIAQRKDHAFENVERLKLEGRERCKRFRLAHPGKDKEQKRQWYLKNREREKLRQLEYRAQNVNHIKAMAAKYRLENKEAIRLRRIADREKINTYFRERELNDPVFKLLRRTRTKMYLALKGVSKSASTLALLGCSVLELWSHLESKFVSGMTRENYGPVWHVDHVKPVASFDLSELDQQRECFHFTNLQPLFVLDNLRKGSKYGSE